MAPTDEQPTLDDLIDLARVYGLPGVTIRESCGYVVLEWPGGLEDWCLSLEAARRTLLEVAWTERPRRQRAA